MKNMWKRCASAMLAAMMLGSAAAVMPAKAEAMNIVVLGDSIALGSTPDGTNVTSYAQLVQAHYGAQMSVFATEHCTTDELLVTLEDAQVQAALESADIILVNIGMHDILDPFLVEAENLKNEFGFENFFDVFSAQLSDYGITDQNELLTYSNALTTAARSNMKTCGANIKTIGSKLDAYCGDGTRIVYQKAYNMMDNLPFYDTLSENRQLAYDKIRNPIGAILDEFVNENIDAVIKKKDYAMAVDAYTFFAGKANTYTYLSRLDMNPNAKGQQFLYEETLAALGEIEFLKGDANHDGVVNATDASIILRYSARIGAGWEDGGLMPATLEYVDVIADGAVNAKDASRVLLYAAMAGAKLDPTWD